jgi:cell division protease FtsH
LRFHARPALAAADVILPAGALDAVDRQIVGMARHRDLLRDAGHPLKRGVLLFGPPGTGKTHTVRYLMAQLPEFTVVLLPGMAQQYIQHACGLARLLQPAMIVMEDVDLVGVLHRTGPPRHLAGRARRRRRTDVRSRAGRTGGAPGQPRRHRAGP